MAKIKQKKDQQLNNKTKLEQTMNKEGATVKQHRTNM